MASVVAAAAENQSNKEHVHEFWQALERAGTDVSKIREAADRFCSTELGWHGHAPIGALAGVEEFVDQFWVPLMTSFPDLKRERHIFFGGKSNGRADGNESLDGKMWVTGTGYFNATFAADYLGVPASGETVAVRWGEFCRMVDGQVVEIYFLVDMVDLIRQAGFEVLPLSRGADGVYPAPAAGDGVLLEPQDSTASAYSLDHIRQFIFDGLNAFDEANLASMGMADFFHPDVQWYGPGGIGACLSLTEFEDLHQRPWLVAYPDRQVQDLTALIAEGSYSAGPGWAGVLATHTGPYLDVGPTGRSIEFNGLDWWKREGEQYVENWVFVDMIHLFDQFGVDLLARITS